VNALKSVARYRDLAASPWPNGAGLAREVVGFEDSGLFIPDRGPWRLAIAELVEPSSFSAMPGIRRTLVPFGGDVELRVDDVHQYVSAAAPFVFSGDSHTELAWLSQPCRAINLMVDDSAAHPVQLALLEHPSRSISLPGLCIALSRGTGVEELDVFTTSPALDGLGVRRWLALC